MSKTKKVGYNSAAVQTQSRTFDIDAYIYTSNKGEDGTVVSFDESVSEKDRFGKDDISSCTFFHLATAFQMEGYNKKLKKGDLKSSIYFRKTDPITVKYGEKMENEWRGKKSDFVEYAEKNTLNYGTNLVLFCVCQVRANGKYRLFNTRITLSASSRNLFLRKGNRFQNGCIFEISYRETTEQERADEQFGDFIAVPLPIDAPDQDYTEINTAVQSFSKDIKEVMSLKGMVSDEEMKEAIEGIKADNVTTDTFETNGSGDTDDLPY